MPIGRLHRRGHLAVPLAVMSFALIVAALLAGCASGQQAAHQDTTRSTGTEISSATSGNRRPAPAIRTISPHYGTVPLATSPNAPAGTISQPWTATRVSVDRIYLSAPVRRCTDRLHFTLRETATKITIGSWAAATPKRTICTFDGVTMFGFVQLPQPLRHRAIEHVPAGQTAL